MPWRPILENIKRKKLQDQYMAEESRERRKKLNIAEENLEFVRDLTKIKERTVQETLIRAHMVNEEEQWSRQKPSNKTIQQINDDLDRKSN